MWLFNGKPYVFDEEHQKKYYGFVYLITNTTNGKMYVGRKYFWTNRKNPKTGRRKKAESDWATYYGSSKLLLEDVKTMGVDSFKREILSLHTTQGQVNFHEIRYQFIFGVLEKYLPNGDPMFYNENILSRYFRNGKMLEDVPKDLVLLESLGLASQSA